MPKVGQWSQLCLRVVRYKKCYSWIKLPKPQRIRVTYKLYKLQQWDIQDKYKIYKIWTRDRKKLHPRAKHAPSGFHPTWTAFTGIYPLKHLRIKQVMPPQVGYSTLVYPHHNNNNWFTRFSVKHKPIYHNTIKDKVTSCKMKDISMRLSQVDVI